MRKLMATVLALTLRASRALAQTAPGRRSAKTAEPGAHATQKRRFAAGKPGAPAPETSGLPFAVEPSFTIGPEDFLRHCLARGRGVGRRHVRRTDDYAAAHRDIRARGAHPQTGRSGADPLSELVTDASVTIVVRQMNSRKVFITARWPGLALSAGV